MSTITKKKKYVKPKLTKITFEGRCAVLGFCKTLNIAGPHPIQGCSGAGGSGSCSVVGS